MHDLGHNLPVRSYWRLRHRRTPFADALFRGGTLLLANPDAGRLDESCPRYFARCISRVPASCRFPGDRLAAPRFVVADLLDRQVRRSAEFSRDMTRPHMPNEDKRFMHDLLTEHRLEQDKQALLDDYFLDIASCLNVAPRNQNSGRTATARQLLSQGAANDVSTVH
jgi:hypothetical protein